MEGWSGWGIPVYRHVLERIVVDRDTRILDVGCGAGRFSRIAADRGAMISGIDATACFVEIARERVLDGDFRVGEMEDLPWADNSFDVVTEARKLRFSEVAGRARENREPKRRAGECLTAPSARPCPRRGWPRSAGGQRVLG